MFFFRWLTLAGRVLIIYTRTLSPSVKLLKLVHYIPAWFLLKRSSKLQDTPSILFTSIQAIKNLTFPDVINIIKDNIRGNAYCLLPENFLYAMVLSEEDNVRSQGLRINLRLKNIREENSEEDLAEKRIPNILGDAGH